MSSDVDTAEWDRIVAAAEHLASVHVEVGVFESAGTTADGELALHDLAAIHEYGDPEHGIPERSFLRSTFREKADRFARVAEQLGRSVFDAKVTEAEGLALLGTTGVHEVRATILNRQTRGPERQENRPETIRRKGSDVPLIATSRLINAISYRISNGKGDGGGDGTGGIGPGSSPPP